MVNQHLLTSHIQTPDQDTTVSSPHPNKKPPDKALTPTINSSSYHISPQTSHPSRSDIDTPISTKKEDTHHNGESSSKLDTPNILTVTDNSQLTNHPNITVLGKIIQTPKLNVTNNILTQDTRVQRVNAATSINTNDDNTVLMDKSGESTAGERSPNSTPTVPPHSSLQPRYTNKPDFMTFWPMNVMNVISSIISTPTKIVVPSVFVFELSSSAAAHNWTILSKFRDLGEALEHDNQSFTRYGSEFRTPTTLAPLLYKHPLWSKLKSILTHGIQFPLSQMSNESRKQDLKNSLVIGNHKGVELQPEFYKKLNISDVEKGYSLPIPLNKLICIPGALACPMNIIEQHSISDTGEIVEKQRACHDLSFPIPPSNLSVNLRVDKSLLHNCMFGYCLNRIIHFIIALRLNFPTKCIFIQKIDWKAAYRRAHTNWTTSIQCCSIYDDYALIPLRATFGGSPCPSEWSVISETTTDLANMLLSNRNWSPSNLHSPHQSRIKQPTRLPTKLPFHPALPLMVNIPIESTAKADVYIDNIITVSLDSPSTNEKAAAAVPLSIHVIGRPVMQHETIPRDDLLSFPKLSAEGQLEEIKNVLGWIINTRTLTIHLPSHKYKVWKASIISIIKQRVAKHKQLDTLIGRLTHLSSITPNILHFMNNLRSLLLSAQKRSKVKIKQQHIDDLHLMLSFLAHANKGVNLNLISHRMPNRIYYADACPVGIGGYNSLGIAWRWKLPLHLQNRATTNMLEHVASTIGPWLDIASDNLPPLSFILSMTDSTTSAGWLRKSNFMDRGDSPSHMRQKSQTSREHASRLMKHQIKEYSQWFAGKQNIIADSLSRDFDIPDSILVSLYHSKFSSQMNPNFRIVPIPPKIDSWLCAWLQQMPVSQLSPKEHQPSTIALGLDGDISSLPLICPMTVSLTPSSPTNAPYSCLPSVTQSVPENIRNVEFLDWVKTQSEMPLTMWHRPSSVTTKATHDLTPMDDIRTFYETNTKDTKRRIQQRNTRNPYPVVSSFTSSKPQQTKDPRP